ncbi:MAG: hypothetical protein R3B09_02300 [Nannocystaceae bacterium]
MRMVFQVDYVLSGDSDTIGLEGRDAAGRRVRLEVPASEGVRPGSVLVVDWWAAELPTAMTTTTATTATTTTEMEDGADMPVAGDDQESVELEFRRLIGLA